MEFSGSDITDNSQDGGLVMVTIGTPAADISPDSQPCKSCLIRHFSGTGTFMNYRSVAVAATSWPLSSSAISWPTKNLNLLHFIGTAGDKVQIMWRA